MSQKTLKDRKIGETFILTVGGKDVTVTLLGRGNTKDPTVEILGFKNGETIPGYKPIPLKDLNPGPRGILKEQHSQTALQEFDGFLVALKERGWDLPTKDAAAPAPVIKKLADRKIGEQFKMPDGDGVTRTTLSLGKMGDFYVYLYMEPGNSGRAFNDLPSDIAGYVSFLTEEQKSKFAKVGWTSTNKDTRDLQTGEVKVSVQLPTSTVAECAPHSEFLIKHGGSWVVAHKVSTKANGSVLLGIRAYKKAANDYGLKFNELDANDKALVNAALSNPIKNAQDGFVTVDPSTPTMALASPHPIDTNAINAADNTTFKVGDIISPFISGAWRAPAVYLGKTTSGHSLFAWEDQDVDNASAPQYSGVSQYSKKPEHNSAEALKRFKSFHCLLGKSRRLEKAESALPKMAKDKPVAKLSDCTPGSRVSLGLDSYGAFTSSNTDKMSIPAIYLGADANGRHILAWEDSYDSLTGNSVSFSSIGSMVAASSMPEFNTQANMERFKRVVAVNDYNARVVYAAPGFTTNQLKEQESAKKAAIKRLDEDFAKKQAELALLQENLRMAEEKLKQKQALTSTAESELILKKTDLAVAASNVDAQQSILKELKSSFETLESEMLRKSKDFAAMELSISEKKKQLNRLNEELAMAEESKKKTQVIPIPIPVPVAADKPQTETKHNGASGSKESRMSKKPFMEMLKEDATNAMYRSAATQMTNGTKAAIVMLMEKQGQKSESIQAIKELLDTEAGAAVISLLIGMGLTYAPKISEDPRAARLAGEFRVNGMSTGINAVMGVAVEHFLPVLTGAMSGLPELEAPVRIAAPTDSSEENEHSDPGAARAING